MKKTESFNDEQEKAIIIAEANRIGVMAAAEKHGLKWQRVASWRRTAKKTPLSKIIAEISAEEILAKAGDVDKIYVRADENKAYWVKEEQNGAIDLW